MPPINHWDPIIQGSDLADKSKALQDRTGALAEKTGAKRIILPGEPSATTGGSVEVGRAPYSPKATTTGDELGSHAKGHLSGSGVDLAEGSKGTALSRGWGRLTNLFSSNDKPGVEIAKGSYGAKTSPSPESPFGESKNGKLGSTDWYEKSSSSKPTILSSGGTSATTEAKGVQVAEGYRPKSSPFPESPFSQGQNGQLGSNDWYEKSTSSKPAILSGSDAKSMKPGGGRLTNLFSSNDKSGVELGKAPYGPKSTPDIESPFGESKDGKLGSSDWFQKSPSSKAVDLGELASKDVGGEVSVGSKILSGAGTALEVAGKVARVAGPVAAVAGYLADPGNLSDAQNIKVGNVTVPAGSSAYYDAVQKELNTKYQGDWKMENSPGPNGSTNTSYIRSLYGADGQITGHITVNADTLKSEVQGTGFMTKQEAEQSHKQSQLAKTASSGENTGTASTTPAQNDPSHVVKQDKVFSYGGKFNVTKNIFADGTVVYTKGGKVLGREEVATSSVKDPAAQGHVAQSQSSGSSSGSTGAGSRADSHSSTPVQTAAVKPASPAEFKYAKDGALLEKSSTGGNWYVAESAKKIASSGLVSEHGGGMGASTPPAPAPAKPAVVAPFYTDTSSSAQVANQSASAPKPAQATATPAWGTNVSPDVVGLGGKDLSEHGTTLATRDSKDGTKIIAQMSDGTYESIDKASGQVAGAGTWGDSHGGGTSVNGIGNPNSGLGVVPPPATSTAPSSTGTSNNTGSPMPPAPEGQALAPPVVPTQPAPAPAPAAPAPAPPAPAPTTTYTDTSSSAQPAKPAPAYTGGAQPVKVEHLKNGATLTTTATGAEIEQMPGHSAYQVKAPTHPAPKPALTIIGPNSLDDSNSANSAAAVAPPRQLHYGGRMLED